VPKSDTADQPATDRPKRWDSLFSNLAPDSEKSLVDSDEHPNTSPRNESAVDASSSTGARNEDTVKRPKGRVLKSILKKPRRWSKEPDRPTEAQSSEKNRSMTRSQATNLTHSDNILQTSDTTSSPSESRDPETRGSQVSITGVASPYNAQTTERSAVQIAAFDRKLFAMRGAALRNEYMRDNF